MRPEEEKIKKHTDALQSKIRSSIAINTHQQCIEELILNSLDSSASCISIRINISTGLLLVVDNGNGINYKSMKVLGERYSTSKSLPLHRKQRSHGYRGEALASIAFLSEKLEITSKCDEEHNTLCKTYHNGKWSLDVAADPRPSKGTTILVSKLFHQSPVQQTLKSPGQIMADVLSKVQRLAVIHCCQASFLLKDDSSKKLLVNTGRVKSIREVIAAVFGADYCSKLRSISGTHDQLQVEGVVSTIAYPSQKLRLISLNKRILNPCKLHQTIRKELKHSLINLPNHQPCKQQGSERVVSQSRNFLYVVNLRCDPRLYDIMIDPRKAKVEFEVWDEVTDSLTKLVRKFLFVNNLNKGAEKWESPEIALQPPVNHSTSSDGMRQQAVSVILYKSDEELSDILKPKSTRSKNPQRPTTGFNKENRKGKQKSEKVQTSANSSQSVIQPSFKSLHGVLCPHLPSPIGPPGGIDHSPLTPHRSNLFVARWILHHCGNNSQSFDDTSDHNWSLKALARSVSFKEESIIRINESPSSFGCEQPLCKKRIKRDTHIVDTSHSLSVSDFFSSPDKSGHLYQRALDSNIVRTKAKESLSSHRPSRRQSWSAPQPTSCSLKRFMNSLRPICRQPLGKRPRYHSSPDSQNRRSAQKIPAYATPVRSHGLSDITNKNRQFCSLSPALQKIFAPLQDHL